MHPGARPARWITLDILEPPQTTILSLRFGREMPLIVAAEK